MQDFPRGDKGGIDKSALFESKHPYTYDHFYKHSKNDSDSLEASLVSSSPANKLRYRFADDPQLKEG